ncbi:hypothetical protein B0A48_03029 [Cryoendolithus antarcticus]|uniref:Uncharacterized protein n=1 Tax=Cryoendolithus antarcticus TaxID=1507870 RepID=A0A1V8TLX9_9PEZI|nr:hypothetical protein B0A48_03029 [Cryoendolithus antarcticus]
MDPQLRIIVQGKPNGSIPPLLQSKLDSTPTCIGAWFKTLGAEDELPGGDRYLIVRDQTIFELVLRVVQWVKHGAYVPFLPGSHIELQVKRAGGNVVDFDPRRHGNDKVHFASAETQNYFKQELEVIELATNINCQELLDYAILNIRHRYPFYTTEIVAVLRKMRDMRTSEEQPLFRDAYLAALLRSRIDEYKDKLQEHQAFLDMLRSVTPIKAQYEVSVAVADAERFDAAAAELRKGMSRAVEVQALLGHLMDHGLAVSKMPVPLSPAKDPRPQRRRVEEGDAVEAPILGTPQYVSKARPSPLRFDKPRASVDRLDSVQPSGATYDPFLPISHSADVPAISQSTLDLAVANALRDSRIIVFARDGRGVLQHDRHDERPSDQHDRSFRYHAGEMLELIPQDEEIGIRRRDILVRNARGEVGAVGARTEHRVAQDVLLQTFSSQRESANLNSPFKYTGSHKREKSEERDQARHEKRSRSSNGTGSNETYTRGPWVPLDRGAKRTKRDYRKS